MSNDMVSDTSRVLPPLTHIEPEKEPLAAIVNARSQTNGGEKDSSNALGSAQRSPEAQQHIPPPEVQSPINTQVRQRTQGHSESIPDSALPETQNEQVQVKTEMTDIPSNVTETATRESAPAAGASPTPTSRRPSATADGLPVSKSIADVKNDASIQPSPTTTTAKASTPKTSDKPKATPSKKRAAPKKGTASAVKPAAKKRKVENIKTESIPPTPSLARNGTPASSRASKTPAPKPPKQDSSTPARSSSVAAADEYEDDDSMSIDENEQFCICRGPDDHTWMIACDGGCDDWFHGRCVEMDEKDGKLIDKYICPNCTSAGRGHTLWKPMCRLSTCRKPARVDAAKRSKYCSEEHGVEFMRQMAFNGEPPSSPKKPLLTASATGRRKSRKDNYTDNFGNGAIDAAGYEDLDAEEDHAYLRGGILRPAELKTLASTTKGLDDFRRLGEGVLSPPSTEGDDPTHPSVSYTDEETAQLAEIKTKTGGLKERKRMLDNKDTFLGMVKARAKGVGEELKKKSKNKGDKKAAGAGGVCGWDSRLAWADEQFEEWRASAEGKAAFARGNLGPVFMIKEDPDKKEEKENTKGEKLVNGDTDDDNHDETAIDANEADPKPEEDDAEDEASKGICTKKACRRHRDWLKVQTNNIALDKESVRVDMKRFLAEEKSLRERAMIRSLEEN